MTAKVWIVAQHRDGRLHRMSREAVAAGQRLAQALGGSASGVVLGHGAGGVAAELAGYRLDAVHSADAEALAQYTPGAYVGVLAAAVAAHAPSHLVFAHTYQSVDFMGLLAQRVGGSLLPEVLDFESAGDDELVWRRPILGGKLQARMRVKGAHPVVLSVQSGAFSADDAASGTAPVQALDATAAAPDREILGVEEVAGEQVDLSAAAVVVAVGRGIGGADRMGIIDELAAALGAEIGASRPVIDSGWLPRDRQIGSSGQTVAPKLYIAVGISGAIQHLVGMKASGTIVAVNKDAGAPIFGVARYGVVGDLHEIVPALTAAIRAAQATGS